MVDHILVPTDGSELATEALEHVLTTHQDATVSVLCAIDPLEGAYTITGANPYGGEQWYERERRRAETVCENAAERAADHGVDVTTAIEVGRPARTIIEYAEDNDVDHIVMGSHGREGLSRILLGSVAETVIRRSPVLVTIVR